mmetsp:Transcript_4780/g.30262  ORF Transcript_4780/g.30262 Transcript_4780/m.30262 type:complete len:85 (+) Transcript_4780:2136-2390(+)
MLQQLFCLLPSCTNLVRNPSSEKKLSMVSLSLSPILSDPLIGDETRSIPLSIGNFDRTLPVQRPFSLRSKRLLLDLQEGQVHEE